jgi:hypothetical protein
MEINFQNVIFFDFLKIGAGRICILKSYIAFNLHMFHARGRDVAELEPAPVS